MSYLSNLISSTLERMKESFGLSPGGDVFKALEEAIEGYGENSPEYLGQIDSLSEFSTIICETHVRDSVSTNADINLSGDENVTLVSVTAGGTTKTVTLPELANARPGPLHIVKADSGAGSVDVAASGSEEINGSSSITLSNQYDSITLWPTGSFWST